MMISSAKSQITPDNDAVVTEIEIAASPARVFQALISREDVLQWGGEQFQITHWEMDARQGGKWRLISRERQGDSYGRTIEHHGEVLRIEAPRLLEYSWFANWHPDPEHRTVVRWDLTPKKSGTHVKVTHSGLAPLPGVAPGYGEGWPGLVQQVKTFVEKNFVTK